MTAPGGSRYFLKGNIVSNANLSDTLEDMRLQAETIETVLSAATRLAGEDDDLQKLLHHALSLTQILANDIDVAGESLTARKAA